MDLNSIHIEGSQLLLSRQIPICIAGANTGIQTPIAYDYGVGIDIDGHKQHYIITDATVIRKGVATMNILHHGN